MLSGLMTVEEVARQLKVTKMTIWRWIRGGKLKAYRIGVRTIRIDEADLKQFIQGRR